MSTPILQEQQPPSTDQLLEKLIDHIDRLTEAKRQPIKSVSLKEASRMLGISDYHLTRKLIDDGTIRGRHAGRKVLVSVQSISEWLGDKETR